MLEKTRVERLLVNYYGVLQSLHLVALAVSGFWLLRAGDLGALALPPQGGWTEQAMHLLIATGLFDGLVAIGAVYFALHYRMDDPRSDVLGSATITGSLYSAAIYIYGTLRSGAVAEHPVIYGLVGLVFAPIIPLAFVFLGRRIRRQGG